MSCVQKASTLARQDHDRLFSEKERRKHPNEKMGKGFVFVGLDKKGVDEVSDTEGHETFRPGHGIILSCIFI